MSARKALRKKIQLSSKIGEMSNRAELREYIENSSIKKDIDGLDEEVILLGLWLKKYLTSGE